MSLIFILGHIPLIVIGLWQPIISAIAGGVLFFGGMVCNLVFYKPESTDKKRMLGAKLMWWGDFLAVPAVIKILLG